MAGGSQTQFPFVATPAGNQTQVPVNKEVPLGN
jgi:hypothetical protein